MSERGLSRLTAPERAVFELLDASFEPWRTSRSPGECEAAAMWQDMKYAKLLNSVLRDERPFAHLTPIERGEYRKINDGLRALVLSGAEYVPGGVTVWRGVRDWKRQFPVSPEIDVPNPGAEYRLLGYHGTSVSRHEAQKRYRGANPALVKIRPDTDIPAAWLQPPVGTEYWADEFELLFPPGLRILIRAYDISETTGALVIEADLKE